MLRHFIGLKILLNWPFFCASLRLWVKNNRFRRIDEQALRGRCLQQRALGGSSVLAGIARQFGLAHDPAAALDRLAIIVRGADTARPDLAPEAAGLLAISLGLSRMHSDDLEQLEAALPVYDALYRWARDATGETHIWQEKDGGK